MSASLNSGAAWASDSPSSVELDPQAVSANYDVGAQYLVASRGVRELQSVGYGTGLYIEDGNTGLRRPLECLLRKEDILLVLGVGIGSQTYSTHCT